MLFFDLDGRLVHGERDRPARCCGKGLTRKLRNGVGARNSAGWLSQIGCVLYLYLCCPWIHVNQLQVIAQDQDIPPPHTRTHASSTHRTHCTLPHSLAIRTSLAFRLSFSPRIQAPSGSTLTQAGQPEVAWVNPNPLSLYNTFHTFRTRAPPHPPLHIMYSPTGFRVDPSLSV